MIYTSRTDLIELAKRNNYSAQFIQHLETIPNSSIGHLLKNQDKNWINYPVNDIIKLYLDYGMCAESIFKELNIRSNVEALRNFISKILCLKRSVAQEEIRKKYRYKLGFDSPHSRKDVRLKSEYIISQYTQGISSCILANEMNCSEDLIRDILKECNIFTIEYINNVRKQGHKRRSITVNSKSIESKRSTSIKRQETRIKINSAESAKQKYIQTIREKYSLDWITNVSQIPEIHEKQQRYRFNKYIFESGEIVNVQGYEHIVLNKLQLKGYTFEDFIFRKTFRYHFNDKDRIYYPDIYIPSENRIIEVKSKYTLNRYLDKNLAIMESMIAKGLIFEFNVVVKDQIIMLNSKEQILKFLST